MRILHSELQYKIGGIESFLLNLAEITHDIAPDIKYEYLMRGSNKIIENRLEGYGYKIYHVPLNRLEYVKFVTELLKQRHYDYVHVHKNSDANILLPMIVCRQTNTKLIVHAHNSKASHPSPVNSILHYMNRSWVSRNAYKKFACSELAGQWIFGNNNAVQFIKNGIITKRYVFDSAVRENVRRKYSIQKKEIVIGDVAALREQKNLDFLINTIKLLPNQYRLMLVGSGKQESYLRDYCARLGVKKRVLFMGGDRQDVNELLMAMDLFAMPSLWEGLPVSAVEAQASGLPLLLSNSISKQTDITGNIQFLPIDSPQKWAKKIIDMNLPRERYNGTTAIRKAGFDMSDSAKSIVDFYRCN